MSWKSALMPGVMVQVSRSSHSEARGHCPPIWGLARCDGEGRIPAGITPVCRPIPPLFLLFCKPPQSLHDVDPVISPLIVPASFRRTPYGPLKYGTLGSTKLP